MSRKLNVVSVSMACGLRRVKSRDENYRYVEKVFRDTKPLQPNVIVLPEIYALAGLEGKAAQRKVCSDDLTVLLDMARKHRVWTVGSLYRTARKGILNSAVVISPEGELWATYDKVHPTETELAEGVLPGFRNQKAIRTPLGTFGVQICFDANWPEDWERLVSGGAEIIFFPSAFPGGTILTSIATLNHVFIVPAVWSLHSGVINNTGQWLVQTDRFQWWVSATIDLERTVYHWDYQGHLLPAIRRRYGNRVHVETYGPEAWFVLTPLASNLPVEEIEREFKLIRYRAYLQRATMAQDKLRSTGKN